MQAEITGHRRSEFAGGWKVLVASSLGVTCGVTAVPIYTIGAFVGPLERAFDWSRGEIQSATVFAYLAVVIAGPVAGWWADQFGARPVALWSVLGIALGVASAAVLTGSLVGFYAAYALIGLLGAGTAPGIWTRAVTGWFHRRRGIALGLTLMGTGIFATLGPRYVTWAIESFGWQGGYLALAAVPLVVVLPVGLLWFRENQHPNAKAEHPELAAGMTLSMAARTRPFWVIAAAFLVFSTFVSAVIGSFIPMLTDSGVSPGEAATIAGAIGLSVIAGRIAGGVLLDHVHAPYLAVGIMLLPAIGCAIWGSAMLGDGAAATFMGPMTAAIMVGLAGGAEFDLVAYMAARYFGLVHYGKITSILFSSVIAGGAFGPALFGFGFDVFGGYEEMLLASAAIFVLTAGAQFLLGPYSKSIPAAR